MWKTVSKPNSTKQTYFMNILYIIAQSGWDKPVWSFSSSISLPLPHLLIIQRVVNKCQHLTLPWPFLEPTGTFEIHLPLTVRLQTQLYSLVITTFNSTSSLVPRPWKNTSKYVTQQKFSWENFLESIAFISST